MRTSFTTIVAIVILMQFHAFAQNTDSKNINKTHWLVGTWKGTHEGKPFFETWRKQQDNSLVCYYIEITDSDTIVSKNTSQIKASADGIAFHDPNVFKAKRIMDNEMVFELEDSKTGNSRLVWLHTHDDHWWAILQFPKTTIYYDIIREPELDKAVEKKIKSLH